MEHLLSDHKRIIKSMPKNIVDSIEWYSDEGYRNLNTRLRNGHGLTNEQEMHMTNISSIFEHIKPLSQSLTLYKGVETEEIKPDKAYVSTTYSIEQAYEFTKGTCCVIVFTVVPGSKVLSIESASVHFDEREILLDKDGQFFITGVEKRHPKTLIHITYLPKMSQPVALSKVPPIELPIMIKEIDKIVRISDIFSKDEVELFEEDEIRDQISEYYKKLYKSVIPIDSQDKIYELLKAK